MTNNEIDLSKFWVDGIETDTWESLRNNGIETDIQETPPDNRRAPRHRTGELFLRGPIPWGWILRLASLPGRYTWLIALLIWRRSGLRKNAATFRFSIHSHNIPRRTTQRGIHAMEAAGLITVERASGKALSITIREVRGDNPRNKRRPRHRTGELFLKGPIPWEWILRLAPLSGRHTWLIALLIWRQSGLRKDAATFQFSICDHNLPSRTIQRGIHAMEAAGLITVERAPGEVLYITIQETKAMENLMRCERCGRPGHDVLGECCLCNSCLSQIVREWLPDGCGPIMLR
jgi:hypothetical protein